MRQSQQRIGGSTSLHPNWPLANFAYSRNVIGNKPKHIFKTEKNSTSYQIMRERNEEEINCIFFYDCINYPLFH